MKSRYQCQINGINANLGEGLGRQKSAFLFIVDEIGKHQLNTQLLQRLCGGRSQHTHDAGELVVRVLAGKEGAVQKHLCNRAARRPNVCDLQ